jgi:molecular chaperone HscB
MDVMEEREALADARAAKDLAKVRKLAAAIADRQKATMARLSAGFADAPGQAELTKLLPLLGELRFYRRFLEEAEAIEEEAEEVSA